MPRPAAMSLAEHRDLIPEEVREEIKLYLVHKRVEGFSDFVDLASFLMSRIATGDIPPEAGDVMHKYMQLQLMALTLNNPTLDAKVETKGDVMRRLEKANREAKTIVAKFSKHPVPVE